VEALLERFFGGETLMSVCKALEEDGMKVRIDLATYRRRLTQRTEALQRARRMLEERAERIAELEAELHRQAGQASA
jgi:acyl-CoA reductase-like NAD-dependent aldehyde dehydrogenase